MPFVEGSLSQYLFYNEESAYSVLKIEIIDTDDPRIARYEPTIVVCGFFPRLDMHQSYRFHGELAEHPKYGLQFNAQSFESAQKTVSGLVDYLSSDLFKGIGPKTAQAIVDLLGESALETIANDKTVLDRIPRMTEAKRDMIHETIIANRQAETTLVWLYGFSISPKMAMKIFNRFGFQAIDIVKANPYVLMDEIELVGFKRADEIALKIGFPYDHPYRIQAVIMYLLLEYMNKYGDTYLEKDRLLDYALSYLNVGKDFVLDRERIAAGLGELAFAGRIIDIEGRISLGGIYHQEQTLARIIKDHAGKGGETIDPETIRDQIRAIEAAKGIVYTPKQHLAIAKALTAHFVIITGGPGTGKTTIIEAITQIYARLYAQDKLPRKAIRLAAPTGKAAKRLSEATALEATTIHRLLGFDYEGKFAFGNHNKIDARLIVLDEVSMLDTALAYQFFQALAPRTKLVLVGDDNQLPSVGPGQILADLIASGIIDLVKLDHIHRQAADSQIVTLAYNILEQDVGELAFPKDKEVWFQPAKETLCADWVCKFVKQALDDGLDLIEDIQVLVPVYKGINGIDRLNELLQERFNSRHAAHQIAKGDKRFYFNDKVMQLVNQPEDGVMNGDIGVVAGIIENKELLVDFSGTQVKYNINDFDNLTLAYAISIHKSQGSEFRCVIMPIVRAHAIMLKRKLLYTAITRAKERLVLIGEAEAFVRGVYGYEAERKTWLGEFLRQEEQTGAANLTIEDFL